MRKFIVTMNQKGELNTRIGMYKNFITYEKTDKKQFQIAVIDFEGIEKQYKEELKKNGFIYSPVDMIKTILRINEKSPLYYSFIMTLREIKENDSKEYVTMDKNEITKETEKAYYIEKLNNWIPKSQTKIDNDLLYVKRWIIAKMF